MARSQSLHGTGLAEQARQPDAIRRALGRSFATRLLETGYGVRVIQELLAHKDVRTTMICTRVLSRGGQGVRSPIAGL